MKNHARAGFSLLEIAIVLIVIGIVVGSAMPSILKFKEQASFRETKERQEVIAHAIAAYVVLTGELPCPADPAMNAPDRGRARKNCGDASSAIGIVPYGDLGLTEAQAKDGSHRFMTYAIPTKSIASGAHFGAGGAFCSFNSAQHLVLKDQNNHRLGHKEVVGKQDVIDFVAFILISHGPKGAFTGAGAERASFDGAGVHERINGDASLNFYDRPYSTGAEPFRQTVKWVTRMNLMGYYGKTPCAQDIKKNPSLPPANLPTPSVPGGLGDPFGRGK